MFARRILAVALALVMVLMLVGCGEPKSEPDKVVIMPVFGELPEGWRWLKFYNVQYDGDNLEFSIKGEHGEYFFVEGDWSKWEPKNILEDLMKIEDAILFVKDWFSCESPWLITIILYPEKFDNKEEGADYYAYANYEVRNQQPGVVTPYDPENEIYLRYVTHEVVHAVNMIMKEYTNFDRVYDRTDPHCYLWEGLAEAVSYFYSIENEKIMNHYINGMKSKIGAETYADLFLDYERFSGSAFNEDSFNFMAYIHASAIPEISYIQTLYSQYERYYFMPYLVRYRTAASFILYLLEIGTKEQFHEAYANVYLMPVVYGKEMVELYDDWLEFLGFDEGNK